MRREQHFREKSARILALAEWRLHEAHLWCVRGSGADPAQIANDSFELAKADLQEHDDECADCEGHVSVVAALLALKAERDDPDPYPYRPLWVEQIRRQW